jgi:hypothetical protein
MKTIVYTKFGPSETAETFRYKTEGQCWGKIVINMENNNNIQSIRRNSDETYETRL